MSRTLVIALVMVGCGGKPASQAPSNVGGGGPFPREVESKPYPCTKQTTCVRCLMASTDNPSRGSCDWDIDNQTCQITCGPQAKNCLLVGTKHLDEQGASEVCNGARQPTP